jgi:transposase
VPAIQSYFIEPIWEQFCALLPEREVNHPLGCHRSRIPDRIVFEKLVQVLVFGCAYWRIANESSSDTTLRHWRDEWIALGVMDTLRELVLEVYDRIIGLELADVAVDGCITKAPCSGGGVGDRGDALACARGDSPRAQEVQRVGLNDVVAALKRASRDLSTFVPCS